MTDESWTVSASISFKKYFLLFVWYTQLLYSDFVLSLHSVKLKYTATQLGLKTSDSIETQEMTSPREIVHVKDLIAEV